VAQDIAEGADAVMVKPALPYLDIVARVADAVHVPVAAYQVSGEYAMDEAAAAQGWVDRRRIILETLTGIRRAGAGMVLTYWAAEVAGWLGES
jgi:porphobilinogen synthase